MSRQRVTVLGSTGSIGVSTLDVMSRHPDRFEVFALTAATRVNEMVAQCRQFRPRYAVMANPDCNAELARKIQHENLRVEVVASKDAIEMVASHDEVDVVMAAIVGAAGLSPCLAAAHAGKRLLLANKEALVVGGQVFLNAVRDGGATLLPIDSEHSAVFQSLPQDRSTWLQSVQKIILTASGGPFRTRDPATFGDITPEQAVAHPNWVMGRKISVDSATMMNKALEVIEAHYLFDMTPEKIEVIIHPQSVIHSMVQYRDASVIAQLGTPDMRGPIAYGLSWPDRIENGAANLDFASLAAMSFEPPSRKRFPGLYLAWEALRAPQGTTAVLNAANEVAVQAFLERRVRFDQIYAINTETLASVAPFKPDGLEDLLDIDTQARASAMGYVAKMERR